MTHITTRAERTLELPTTFGAIRVLFHDDTSAYVTFGQHSSTEPSTPPLKLPRGVELSGSSHYKRPVSDITGDVSGSWRPAGQHATAYESFRRGAADATAKQAQTAREAIIEALDAWSETDTGREMLATLRQLKAHGDACEYRERAAELRKLAEQCDLYADALEAGARLRYRILEHTSSFEEHVRMVQLRPGPAQGDPNTGVWMTPLQGVAMPHGTTNYDPATGVRGHKDDDR